MAFALHDLLGDFQRERRLAEGEALRSAQRIAEGLLHQLGTFNGLLAELDSAELAQQERCRAMRVPRRLVAALGLLGADGRLICASAPLPQEYVEELIRLAGAGGTGVRRLRDPLSESWLTVMTRPRVAGQRLYLLFSQQAVLESVLADVDAQVLLIDESGVVVARSSEPGRWIGRDTSDTLLAEHLLNARAGTLRTEALDGEDRIFGFTAVEDTGWHVAASYASSVVFAQLHRDTLRQGLLGLAILILAGTLATRFYRHIAHPLRGMADAAAALAHTETGRVPVAGGSELRLLAERFNALLAARAAEETKLRESEERFRAMADAAPVMIWLDDAERRAQYFNRGWLEFTRRSLADELAQGWEPLLHPDDRQRCKAAYDWAWERRSEFTLEYRLQRHDGEYRWILDHGVPRFDADGQFSGYIGVGIDITERRLAEERLRISEQRLNEAQAIARVGNWEMNTASGEIIWSDAMYGIFGVDRDSADQLQLRRITEALARGRPGMFDKSITLPDRSVRFLRGWFGTQPGIDGSAARLVGVVQDVTAERRAADRQATLTSMLEGTSDFVCIADADGQLRYINAAGRQMIGLGDDEDISQLDIRRFAPPEQDQDRLTGAIEGALERGHWSGELELASQDGRRIPVSVVALLHRDGQNRPQFLSLMARDITPQKRMERALRESESRLRTIIDSEPECVKVVSPGGQLLEMNAAGLAMIGADSLAEVRHRRVLDLVAPQYHAAYEEMHKAVLAGESRELEFEIVGLRSRRRNVRTHAVPLRNQRGRIIAQLAITHDVTERRRAQQRIRDSQAQLEGIVQSAMDGIVSVDEDQRIVIFNRAAEQMFRCPASEAIGTRVSRFLPERLREAHERGIARFAASGQQSSAVGAPATLRGLRTDGTEFPIEASVSQVEVEGRKLFTVILRDITARLAAQQALHDSQERLRIALRAARMGTWFWDVAEDRTHYSDEVGPLYGLEPGAQHVHREAFSRAVHRHDLLQLRDARDAALRGEAGYDVEYRVIWPDGSVHWLGAQGEVLRDEAGEPVSMAGVVFDLTASKLAEQAAEQGRVQLEMAMQGAGLGVWYRDLLTGEVNYSPQLLGMFDLPVGGDVDRDDLLARVHPEDRERCVHALRATEERGEPMEISYRVIWPDGSLHFVHATGRMFRDAHGEPAHTAGIMIDLTSQRLAQLALQQSESQRRLAMQAARMGSWTIHLPEQRLEYSAEFAALLTGRSGDPELTAERMRELIHPEDLPRVSEALRRTVEKGKPLEIEHRVVWPEGSVHWLSSRGRLVRDAAGTPLHVMGITMDVTQTREFEESATRLGRLLEESLNEIYVFDANTLRCQQANGGARENIGYSMQELNGMTLAQIAPSLGERRLAALLSRLARQEPKQTRLSTEFRRKDGSTYAAEVYLQRSKLQGAPVFVAFVADISEKLKQRRRLEQYAARLHTLSRRLMEVQESERRHIARELHDEIGQSLTALKINLQMAGSGQPDPLIEESVEIADRVLSEVRDLSLELRPSMLDDLGLAPALRWYLERQARVGGFDFQLEAEAAERRLSPEVETTAFRIVQEAVTNVVRHAGARNVEVVIECDEDSLSIAVSDDGCGFDVESSRRQSRRGDSFGLLGMRERAMLLGGELVIESSPGQGSTVRACLPLVQAPAIERRRARSLQKLARERAAAKRDARQTASKAG